MTQLSSRDVAEKNVLLVSDDSTSCLMRVHTKHVDTQDLRGCCDAFSRQFSRAIWHTTNVKASSREKPRKKVFSDVSFSSQCIWILSILLFLLFAFRKSFVYIRKHRSFNNVATIERLMVSGYRWISQKIWSLRNR